MQAQTAVDLHSLDAYQYELPPELIAQRPSKTRGASRLMIVHRNKKSIQIGSFADLPHFLKAGDRLLCNNTQVIRARLLGKRPTGGAVEIFLSKPLDENRWEVMAKPLRKLPVGTQIFFSKEFSCIVRKQLPNPLREVEFLYKGSLFDQIQKHGQVPLPPYIQRNAENQFDGERYQTVFATTPGAVAAPTAGLHFTSSMLSTIKQQGTGISYVTLHVGLGTFRSVEVEDIRKHTMHTEWMQITEQTAQEINQTQERCICIGTTACRTLESATNDAGIVYPTEKETNLFIFPGYRFRKTDALFTNFHLPGSTLLMLVSAFAGYDLIRKAYQRAIQERFQFFSYGDAMLIL